MCGRQPTKSKRWGKLLRMHARAYKKANHDEHRHGIAWVLYNEQKSLTQKRKRKLALGLPGSEWMAIFRGIEESSISLQWMLPLFCACTDIYTHPDNSKWPNSQKLSPQNFLISGNQWNCQWIYPPCLSCKAEHLKLVLFNDNDNEKGSVI